MPSSPWRAKPNQHRPYKQKTLLWFSELFYDIKMSVDTAGIYESHQLDIPSENKHSSKRYQASRPEAIRLALRYLPKEVSEGGFCDIGSGKGKALLIASKFGFKKLYGIEHSKYLADISKNNLEKLALHHGEVFIGDAKKIAFPTDVTTFYLYNPFDEESTKIVAERLYTFAKKGKKQIYIIYVVPVHDYIFQKYFLLEKEFYANKEQRVVIFSSKT